MRRFVHEEIGPQPYNQGFEDLELKSSGQAR